MPKLASNIYQDGKLIKKGTEYTVKDGKTVFKKAKKDKD